MSNSKIRYIYISTTLDMSLFEIILSSCKYIIFDKKEIIDQIEKSTNHHKVRDFLLDEEIKKAFGAIIKDKKNRHIIYIARKSDPANIMEQIKKLVKLISPSSEFHFCLVTNSQSTFDEYIYKEFYSVYKIDH